MRHILLIALLSSTAALAQQIPLPAFTSTYTSTTQTRGFWFQSPINCVITGLRVPDETNQGVQCVEVSRFTAAPATYSATSLGTQLFFASNQPSANIIPCSIAVTAGDFIGVLGACGTTTMYNSYGAGPFASSILGSPVTLTRLLTQTNLNNTGGNQPMSSSAGSIARVEVYVAGAQGYASATPYGLGCGGLGHLASARPVIGTTIALQTTNVPAGSPIGATMLGLTEYTTGIDLTGLGMPGCWQYGSIDATLVFFPSGGTGSQPFAIPNATGLAGVILVSQGASFATGVNQLGVITSNGLRLSLDLL